MSHLFYLEFVYRTCIIMELCIRNIIHSIHELCEVLEQELPMSKFRIRSIPCIDVIIGMYNYSLWTHSLTAYLMRHYNNNSAINIT